METIAPDTSRARPLLRLFAGMAIVGAILTFVGYPERGGSPAAARPFEYGVLMLVLGVLAAAYVWLWLRNSRLLVGVGRFGFRDAFGRDHVWTQDQVGRVVDIAILDTGKDASARRTIYFLRPDGRTLLLLNPNAWSANAVDQIVQVTGKVLEQPGAMTRTAFIARFPHATSWIGRHQNITLVAMLTVPLGVVIAITLIQR